MALLEDRREGTKKEGRKEGRKNERKKERKRGEKERKRLLSVILPSLLYTIEHTEYTLQCGKSLHGVCLPEEH